jgi:catechol 2,3-dioxygenase-like lactoylglutathione lyase family enzyme
MAKVDAISNVGIFVSNQKRARDFYTKKLGLKVVGGMPDWGYLELAVKKGGKDAVLNLWTPKAWGLSAKEAKKKVGVTTGIGFSTDNFEGTVALLRKRGVKVDVWSEGEGYHMASVKDPDGNAFFISADAKSSKKKAGVTALDFVTISSRNSKRSGAFFQRALGLKKVGRDWAVYRATPGGTALMPFTPKKSNYERVSDYKADLAAIGEDTAIMLKTKSAYTLEKELKKKGVKFETKMEPQDWGGVSANIFDPDRNKYMLFQPGRPKN